jgi:asparagine synthase (glutamine-hydrolysing)
MNSDASAAGRLEPANPASGTSAAAAVADRGAASSGVRGDLCVGAPRFKDPALQALAAREGPLAAWRAAYARHGTAAASHAEGDFGVAIDTPGGGTFLAIDRFAIRTLCYRIDGDRLQVAPRADELAGPDAPLDLQALFDYLYFHVVPSPRTVFKHVFRLPPGHFALFEKGTLTVAPYWQPQFIEGRGRTFESLRDEFLQLVQEAVARRIDERATGCYLSGGTDSSTVSGMVTRITGRPAETFSIGFDVPGYDEMHYARVASRHFGTHHDEYYITPDDLVRGMPLVAASYDQPFGNSSAVPAYYCARAARGEGLGKLLAGDGGDELFGGNSRYAKQRIFGAYDAMPAALRKTLAEPLVDTGMLDRVPLVSKAASYVRQARVPMPDRLQTYNLLDRVGPQSIFPAEFLRRIDASEPARHQREVYGACDPTASLVNKMLAYDWRYTLAENDLPKVVGSARLAQVDVGFPFLDDRLLEFSLSLPTAYKVRGLKLRWFFKEALRGFLPDEILTKKKHGFGLPFGPWAVEHKPLHELARESLCGLAGRGIVRADIVDELLDQRLVAHPGFYGELVWIMTMLEQWLRAHAPGFAIR